MIKSVRIKNFRSYKDTFLEFSEGVNVIVGANGSGKSNLIRALNWVINNQPAGDDFRPNYWDGDPSVEIEIDGYLIQRKKTKSENLYILTPKGDKKEVFKAFGRGKIPDKIKEILNISDLNINFQLDRPFLLGESPPEVARFFNGLVNLDVIDKSLSNIATTLRQERAKLTTAQEALESKTKELKEFDWLPEAEKRLVELEKQEGYIKHLNSQWTTLAGLIDRLEKLEIKRKDFEKITCFEKQVNSLIKQSEEIKSLENEYNRLFDLIEKIENLNKQKNDLSKVIKLDAKQKDLIKESEEIRSLENEYSKLEGYINKLEDLLKSKKRYERVAKLDAQIKALAVLDREIEKGIDRYNRLEESLEKLTALNQKKEKLGKEIDQLEFKFKKILPGYKCPIFDVPCERLKEAKN